MVCPGHSLFVIRTKDFSNSVSRSETLWVAGPGPAGSAGCVRQRMYCPSSPEDSSTLNPVSSDQFAKVNVRCICL